MQVVVSSALSMCFDCASRKYTFDKYAFHVLFEKASGLVFVFTFRFRFRIWN